MATVIDSLIVTLGLDNKDFQQGMKDTEKGLSDTRKNTDRVGKQIAASGKDAAEFFGQMQRSAIKFFAVLTAGKGLINFTRDVVSTGANLSRLSKNLNISADTMHRWGKASELNGGSMEGFLGTLQNLNNQVTEIFMKGDSAITPYLRQLGVSVTDAAGKAKPLTAVLGDIADATEKAFPDRQQRYAYLQQMGFDEGTINLIAKGGKELRATLAAQQGFSQKDADAAYRAEQTWIKAQQRLEKMTRELVIKVLPSLERLAESFVKMTEVIIPPLSKAVEIFAELDEKTEGWSTSLILALATLRLLGGSAVIGGIASLSATMAGLAAGAASLAAPLGFLLYSGGLNKGEDEELRKLQGENYMGPTVANKKGSSVAERHNNPGNLVFAGQRGATVGETVAGHTFAKFQSTEEGIAALYRQLQLFQQRGIDTISEVMEVYAPRKTNNTGAYINALSKTTGIDPNQQLNFGDPATAAAMIRGISQHEAGKSYLNDQQILSGINMAQGGGGGSSSVSIGQITVQTQATDARGIASGLKGEIVRQFDAGIR
ncbi:hypothetical protein [Pseudomonas sp.]|uniref:hypothetical protein n=1 Tax=Pseudomonas sp. TaxID=306 RepID=UPI002FC874E8